MHVRTRPALLALALLLVASLGNTCNPVRIFVNLDGIQSPSSGQVVTSFSFPLAVALKPSEFDESTLSVTLNGVPLTTTPFAPSAYIVSANPGNGDPNQINPGPPLLDSNLLVISVQKLSGVGSAQKMLQFDYLPPKARAFEIANPADLIEGPMAHNRVGDYMLENDIVRYVVQDAGQRDLYMAGQFGGNLIDAELKANPGHESFGELQAMLNIETVVNAQPPVEIVNDGQDGTAAIVRSCGPDDLLDFINASSQAEDFGASVPPSADDIDHDIEACTEFVLEPETREIEIVTTVTNNETSGVRLYIGDWVVGGGELETFARTGDRPPAGIGELVTTIATLFLGYYGFDEARGNDYSLSMPRIVTGHVANKRSSTFTTSGVTVYMHSMSIPEILGLGLNSWFRVAPNGGTRSFNRFFAVGDGSLANGVEMEGAVTDQPTGTVHGCVTVGGQPAAGALVAIGYVTPPGPDLASIDSHMITGTDGCYSGAVFPGDWSVVAAQQGAPYEGGGSTPTPHPVSVIAGGDVEVNIALPATGRLRVNAFDASGAVPSPTPARVSVVGFDPSPPIDFSDNSVGFVVESSLFEDNTKDAIPAGLTRTEYLDASGSLEFDLEPGQYEIAVSRGGEYSVHRETVTLSAGATTTVDADLVRVLETPGFISADYHVHVLESPDSWISRRNRALSFAGEGVEVLIATDHSAITDLQPDIDDLLLTPYVHATIGEEITTPDYGHFNAYPQGRDATKISGGSTDWAGAAPAGQDFPSFGNYSLTPAEIEAATIAKPQNAGLETVVQINHFDSHFNPLRIDTSLEPPQSFADGSKFRLDPSVLNYFHPFAALELWNGYSTGHQDEFLVDGRIGIWMNLLNQGYAVTGIADTDTHTFHNTRTAGARTWTPSTTDAPAAVSDNEIGLAVKAGKAVGGQGLYALVRVSASSTGESAGFELSDATSVTVNGVARPGVYTSDGTVDLEIDLQAPIWAEYDSIEIYANAQTTVVGTNEGTNTMFDALPEETLALSGSASACTVTVNQTDEGCTFTRSTVNVKPSVSGAERFETSKTVTITGLAEDTWLVVVAKGSLGTSPPTFPVFPASVNVVANPTLNDLKNLDANDGGVRALAFTNPLYVDVDGNGAFDPPGVDVVP